MNQNPLNDIRVIILACATIGLAPFVPEPHVLGKMRWVLGRAKDMQLMDWFDLVMHGLPWLLLFRYFIFKYIKNN